SFSPGGAVAPVPPPAALPLHDSTVCPSICVVILSNQMEFHENGVLRRIVIIASPAPDLPETSGSVQVHSGAVALPHLQKDRLDSVFPGSLCHRFQEFPPKLPSPHGRVHGDPQQL